jgi:IS30 family transposase
VRPKTPNERAEIGHKEGDTAIGLKAKSAAVHTETDRKPRLFLAIKMPNKTSLETAKAIKQIAKSRYGNEIKSLTLNHGCEYALHESVTGKLESCLFR